MSTVINNKITTNGLIFAFDMGDKKSYRGKPTSNIYADITTSSSIRTNTRHFWDGHQWLVNTNYTHPGVEGPRGQYLGVVYKHTSGALNSTWSGNSYGYMLKSIAVTNGASFTLSAWTYVSEDCNISGMPTSIESATSTSSVAGYSVAYDMSNKGKWQRIARSCVGDGANMNVIPVYPQRTGVTDGSFTGFFMWAAPQFEAGTTVSPYAGDRDNYARSSSQSLVSLVRKQNINSFTVVNSLTYDDNMNTFSFDGSSSAQAYDLSATTGPNGIFEEYTVDLIFKPDVVESHRNPFDACFGYGNYGPRLEMNSAGNLVWVHGNSAGSYTTTTVLVNGLQANQYHHVTFVRRAGNFYSYYNGQFITSSADTYPNDGDRFVNVMFGRGYSTSSERWFKGEIPIGRIYNRALNSNEVLNNFEATKARFF